jgi:hypothetical protein
MDLVQFSTLTLDFAAMESGTPEIEHSRERVYTVEMKLTELQ